MPFVAEPPKEAALVREVQRPAAPQFIFAEAAFGQSGAALTSAAPAFAAACKITPEPTKLPAIGKDAATVIGLSEGAAVGGALTLHVTPHVKDGSKKVHQVRLLVDGESVAGVTDAARPLHGLKFELATQAFPPGKHAISLEVLDRPQDTESEVYDRRVSKPVSVNFSNNLWLTHFTGVIEARLVVNFGSVLKGGWKLSVRDDNGALYMEQSGTSAGSPNATYRVTDKTPNPNYRNSKFYDVSIAVTPDSGEAPAELSYRLTVRQR